MPGQEEPQQAPLVKFAPPDVTDIPNDENRNHILLGRRLLAQTKKLLPENVGNGLKRVQGPELAAGALFAEH